MVHKQITLKRKCHWRPRSHMETINRLPDFLGAAFEQNLEGFSPREWQGSLSRWFWGGMRRGFSGRGPAVRCLIPHGNGRFGAWAGAVLLGLLLHHLEQLHLRVGGALRQAEVHQSVPETGREQQSKLKGGSLVCVPGPGRNSFSFLVHL